MGCSQEQSVREETYEHIMDVVRLVSSSRCGPS
jgi:hypothetical protein